jgi:hypothetical protein
MRPTRGTCLVTLNFITRLVHRRTSVEAFSIPSAFNVILHRDLVREL